MVTKLKIPSFFTNASAIGLVLVSSKTKKLEKFKRLEDGNYLYMESNENHPFPIDAINMELNLEDVYNKIDWSLVESSSII